MARSEKPNRGSILHFTAGHYIFVNDVRGNVIVYEYPNYPDVLFYADFSAIAKRRSGYSICVTGEEESV